MKTRRRVLLGVMSACALIAGCKSQLPDKETTPEGLERVASRSEAGVFRLPGVTFDQYKRVILEPATVTFMDGWEKNHPDLSDKEKKRIRDETTKAFREEFEREMIRDGKFTYANDPGIDVLVVSPAIKDLDIPAPDSDDLDKKSLAPRSVGLTVVGELHDAASNVLVGRIEVIKPGERYGLNEMRPVNRGTNAFEIRNRLRDWNRVLREALNVAKTQRPKP